MTAQEKIAAALILAKEGNFAEARNILLVVEAGRRASDEEVQRAWTQFGKFWRRGGQ